MSKTCPTHPGSDAHHMAVVIDWNSREVSIRHYCVLGHGDDPTSIGDGHSWLEPARDPDAVLRKFGLSRIEVESEQRTVA